MSHLDEGTLHALLDGELELADVKEIQMHLGTCAACGSRLQDVKQFLAEADNLVSALALPPGGTRSPAEAQRAEAQRREPPAPRRDPVGQKPFREQENWAEPPTLLLPDPLEGLAKRKRWMRGLRLAAMIALVVLGGKLLTNTLRPGRPELQFSERDELAPRAEPPAVVSPEELGRQAPPAAARQNRSTPANRTRTAKVAPAPVAPQPDSEPKLLADQASDSARAQGDSTAASTGAAAQDSTPAPQLAAAATESVTPAPSQQAGDGSRDADLETRRAASAALAELDRERVRARANAATAALPPTRAETPALTEAPPPPPRTPEQRAQVYLRIGLDEAVRQLGRPVHVIEAMTPEFIGLTQGRNVAGADAGRPVVRVVYLDSRGRMILLDQQRLLTGQSPSAPTSSLRWTMGDVMLYLHGDAPPDVLRNLQRRVR